MEKKYLSVYQFAGACSNVQMKLFLGNSGIIGVLVYAVFVAYLKWSAIKQCWSLCVGSGVIIIWNHLVVIFFQYETTRFLAFESPHGKPRVLSPARARVLSSAQPPWECERETSRWSKQLPGRSCLDITKIQTCAFHGANHKKKMQIGISELWSVYNKNNVNSFKWSIRVVSEAMGNEVINTL